MSFSSHSVPSEALCRPAGPARRVTQPASGHCFTSVRLRSPPTSIPLTPNCFRRDWKTFSGFLSPRVLRRSLIHEEPWHRRQKRSERGSTRGATGIGCPRGSRRTHRTDPGAAGGRRRRRTLRAPSSYRTPYTCNYTRKLGPFSIPGNQ